MIKLTLQTASDWLFKTGVIVIACILPLDQSENLATAFPYLTLIGLLCLLQRGVIESLRRRPKRLDYLLALAFALPVASAALSSATALNRNLALTTAAIFAFVAIRGWLLAGYARLADIKLFEDVTLLMTVLVIAFGYYQFFGDVAGLSTNALGLLDRYTLAVNSFPRVQSTALEPLYLAHYLVLPIGILLHRLIKRPKGGPFWEKALLVATLALFITTNSRGAIAALLVSIVLLSVVTWRNKRFIFSEIKLIAMSIALVAAMLGIVSVVHNMKTLSTFGGHVVSVNDGSQQTRYEIWPEALPVFAKSPIDGVGPYNSRLALHPEEVSEGTLVEQLQPFNNDYLAYLTEQGLVGLAAIIPLVWLLLTCIRRVIKSKYLHVGSPYAIALVAMAIQAGAFHSLYLMRTWAVVGLLVAAWRLERTGKRHEALQD